jgi:hypothetical protein
MSIIIQFDFGSVTKGIFYASPFLLLIYSLQNISINLNEFLFFFIDYYGRLVPFTRLNNK